MTKTIYYTYLGENGTVTTPIYLEGIFSVKKYLLAADDNKVLTKDGIHFVEHIYVSEKDIPLWYEIDKNGQM